VVTAKSDIVQHGVGQCQIWIGVSPSSKHRVDLAVALEPTHPKTLPILSCLLIHITVVPQSRFCLPSSLLN
jgi:hypothetical protein